MQTPMNHPGTSWQLRLERDGTEDFLIICDNKDDEIIRSTFFWMPEEHDPVPRTLAAVWLMFNAPKLLVALKTLAEQADQDCPARSRSSDFIAAL
jgi:hypothetical protein